MGTNDSFDSYYKNLENNGSEIDSSNSTPVFDFLQPKEKPKSSSNANQTATLTVKADTDVRLYCDGEFVDEFEANKVKRTTIPTGQHILTIESAQYDDITEDREIDASDPNKTYTLLVKDMKVKEEERQKEADKRFEKLCELYGWSNDERNEEENSLEHCRKLAEQGDMDAQCELGDRYFWGNDVPQNYKLAFDWYLEAAKQGHAGAQYHVAEAYRDGYVEGVPQNYYLAAEWYRDAAEQGHDGAQMQLGTCYALGWGVPQDYTKAIEWYKKAAKQGCYDAIKKIKIVEKYIY